MLLIVLFNVLYLFIWPSRLKVCVVVCQHPMSGLSGLCRRRSTLCRPLTLQIKQNEICVPGNESLWTTVTMTSPACESQCVWPALIPACSSQPLILLLLWWVWLMTSSGPRCHIAPPLIVLSTASVGPDNRIRPTPYRPGLASKTFFIHVNVCVCMCVQM